MSLVTIAVMIIAMAIPQDYVCFCKGKETTKHMVIRSTCIHLPASFICNGVLSQLFVYGWPPKKDAGYGKMIVWGLTVVLLVITFYVGWVTVLMRGCPDQWFREI